MRAAVYARLSRDRAGLSEAVEIQEQECRAYAPEVAAEVVAVFVDNDVSASRYSTKPRPGYFGLLDAIRAGDVDTVIVTEMTRLYRRLEELLVLIKLSETTSLRKIAVTDGGGYNLSTGEGIFNAVSAVNTAMLESRKISDRVKRRKRASAEQGRNSGGGRAYGFEVDGITVVDYEAALLRDCVRRVIAGDRISVITRELNERGVTTMNGNRWIVANLRRLLLNKRYVGIRVHNDAEYPAIWPSIFSEEEQELVRLAYRQSASLPARPKGVRSYLLTGFVFCGVCDRPLVGNAHTRDGVSQRRYKCRSVDNHGLQDGCGKVYRVAEPLELFVAEDVLYRLDTTDLAVLLSQQDNAPNVSALMERFDKQKKLLDGLVDDMATGLLSKEQFARAKITAETALERLRTEMFAAQQRRTLMALPTSPMREAWENGSLDWRRQILSLLVNRVVVEPGHPGGRFWHGYRFDERKVSIVWRG